MIFFVEDEIYLMTFDKLNRKKDRPGALPVKLYLCKAGIKKIIACSTN